MYRLIFFIKKWKKYKKTWDKRSLTFYNFLIKSITFLFFFDFIYFLNFLSKFHFFDERIKHFFVFFNALEVFFIFESILWILVAIYERIFKKKKFKISFFEFCDYWILRKTYVCNLLIHITLIFFGRTIGSFIVYLFEDFFEYFNYIISIYGTCIIFLLIYYMP